MLEDLREVLREGPGDAREKLVGLSVSIPLPFFRRNAAGIGKASFSEDKLVENIKALADAVQKAKPAGAKGTYIQRVAISSTMGPGVKVDPNRPGE